MLSLPTGMPPTYFTESAFYERSCANVQFNKHVLTLQKFQAKSAYSLILWCRNFVNYFISPVAKDLLF